jgi:hypothetical protein
LKNIIDGSADGFTGFRNVCEAVRDDWDGWDGTAFSCLSAAGAVGASTPSSSRAATATRSILIGAHLSKPGGGPVSLRFYRLITNVVNP